ncbi:MAG: hypothetical protein UU21_C0012G0009 [Candidatus Levybacteria bacterium GW2011_GWA2_40_8]|nr:MAG: hypothetical protein UU21_C0012G0009 [Candidatus Levybacteria bacterium GW2011_GWA2_40_8]
MVEFKPMTGDRDPRRSNPDGDRSQQIQTSGVLMLPREGRGLRNIRRYNDNYLGILREIGAPEVEITAQQERFVTQERIYTKLPRKETQDEIEARARNSYELLVRTAYDQTLSAISHLKRDVGVSDVDTNEEKARLQKEFLESVKDRRRRLLTEAVTLRRQLAVSGFPMYFAILQDLSPHERKSLEAIKAKFESDGTDDQTKAGISEEIRRRAKEIIHSRALYSADQLKTISIDQGVPQEEAEEESLMKIEAIDRTSSVTEMATHLNSLRVEVDKLLLSSIEVSITVWEALHPTEGFQLRESFEGLDEARLIRKARSLYRRTSVGLGERRKAYFKKYITILLDGGMPDGQADREIMKLERIMNNYPRVNQIAKMASEDFDFPELNPSSAAQPSLLHSTH